MSDTKKADDVWFVRGVPVELREAIKQAAQEHRVPIGRIVSDALRRHLSDMPSDNTSEASDTSLRAEVAALAERVAVLEAGRARPAVRATTDAAPAQTGTGTGGPATRMLSEEQAAEAVRLKVEEGLGERKIGIMIGATRDQVSGALKRAGVK